MTVLSISGGKGLGRDQYPSWMLGYQKHKIAREDGGVGDEHHLKAGFPVLERGKEHDPGNRESRV